MNTAKDWDAVEAAGFSVPGGKAYSGLIPDGEYWTAPGLCYGLGSAIGGRAMEAKLAGDFSVAEDLYLQAQDMRDLLAITNLGFLYWQTGRCLEARQQFMMAGKWGYLPALWDLGNMYMEIGWLSGVLPAFMMSRHDHPEAFRSLVAWNALRNQYEASLFWFDRAIENFVDVSVLWDCPAEEVRSMIIREIDGEMQGATSEAEALADLFFRADSLATGALDLSRQQDLCDLRWELASRRPLGPSQVSNWFGAVSVAVPMGILSDAFVMRAAGGVIPNKADLWANAADAFAILIQLFVDEHADEALIGETAMKCSAALQESLAIGPRALTEREGSIVENLISVFTARDNPLAGFYESYSLSAI
jgi:hypothetical protein